MIEPTVRSMRQGNRIKIIKCIDWKDVDEPCKVDTPA